MQADSGGARELVVMSRSGSVCVCALYARGLLNANEDSRCRNLLLCLRRKWWSGRWRGWFGAALVLASAALCGSVPVAAASSSDAQATHAYLVAQYKLAMAVSREAVAARGAESAVAAQIAREC